MWEKPEVMQVFGVYTLGETHEHGYNNVVKLRGRHYLEYGHSNNDILLSHYLEIKQSVVTSQHKHG